MNSIFKYFICSATSLMLLASFASCSSEDGTIDDNAASSGIVSSAASDVSSMESKIESGASSVVSEASSMISSDASAVSSALDGQSGTSN